MKVVVRQPTLHTKPNKVVIWKFYDDLQLT
jgi:hypothetical protein